MSKLDLLTISVRSTLEGPLRICKIVVLFLCRTLLLLEVAPCTAGCSGGGEDIGGWYQPRLSKSVLVKKRTLTKKKTPRKIVADMRARLAQAYPCRFSSTTTGWHRPPTFFWKEVSSSIRYQRILVPCTFYAYYVPDK